MNKDFKIVFVDKILPISDYEKEIIENFGCTVQQYNAITPEEIIEAAKDADAIMTVGGKFTKEAIDGLEKCKVIARYGVGVDNVDLEAATEKGIIVTYVPIYCQEEVATLAVTLMLACERRILAADKTVKNGNWAGTIKVVNGARSPRDKVFGLLGFGAIARAVVPLVKPFGVKVIAYDPYINLDFCKELGVESVTFDEIIETADYISLHVPLLPSTIHMLGEEEFRKMKSTTIVINTGRGALIDQNALVAAIKAGEVAAAGLDVLEFEPPNPEDEIFKMDSVITTGHIGAATEEALVRLRCSVAESVVDVLSNRMPKTVANPKVLEQIKLEQ